jgi:16S rRNA (guanine(1405)-N(7))-methyltransferase
MKNITDSDLHALVAAVRSSKKYRDMNLPLDFLIDLAAQAASNAQNLAEVKTIFRKSLHNVIAPYLETINYTDETLRLQTTPEISADILDYCRQIMQKHASTRERIPFLEDFAACITEEIGQPETILDLACALDPLCLPWFDFTAPLSFLAYDVNGARVKYLQTLFDLHFPFADAIQQDIFLHPPQQAADCAFFFKEAHRLEKRQPGGTALLLQQLRVDVVVLSLPATDLAKHHSLESYHSTLVEKAIEGQAWSLKKETVGGELLFFLRKGER